MCEWVCVERGTAPNPWENMSKRLNASVNWDRLKTHLKTVLFYNGSNSIENRVKKKHTDDERFRFIFRCSKRMLCTETKGECLTIERCRMHRGKNTWNTTRTKCIHFNSVVYRNTKTYRQWNFGCVFAIAFAFVAGKIRHTQKKTHKQQQLQHC